METKLLARADMLAGQIHKPFVNLLSAERWSSLPIVESEYALCFGRRPRFLFIDLNYH